MKKAIVWGMGIVVGVPLVLAATAAILVNTIDQQALLNKASAIVKEKQQRDLAFTGPVQLKWFPSIGADLNGVTLSEFQSTDQFLKADKVSISLALLPLLSSAVVVDAIQASGVTVNVVKNADGKFNFDDLSKSDNQDEVQSESEPSPDTGEQALNFSVDSIALENLNVAYIDKQTGLEASLNNFAMQSGRIEPGVPTDIELKGNVKANKPQADLNIDLNTRLEFGLGENLYANFENLKFAVLGQLDQQQADVNVQASTLNVNPNTLEVKAQSLDAKAKGQLPNVGAFDVSLISPSLELSETVARGEALNFKADLKQATRSINATLDLAGLQGNLKQAVSAALKTTVNLVEGERTVNLQLASPMTLNMKSQLIELAALTGQLDVKDPALPKKQASMPLAGRLAVNNTEKTAELDLNSKFEATSFDLKAAVKNFAKPAITAVLNADKLDIDALLPPKKNSGTKTTSSSAEKPQDTPVDLSPLRNLNLDLTANIGELKVSNIQAQQLKTKAVARGGKLTISPLDAKLYGGSTTGVITADANTQTVTVNQNMTGVQIQPVIKALLDKDMVEGKGNVGINIRTTGNTVNQMKAALDGKVSVSLQDGAIKGINLAERFRNAKSLLSSGSNSTQKTDTTQKTDFSSLAVSFDIANGVASSNDLNVMAPLFRIGGEGRVNLVNNSLDYLAKASVVATSTGQGGKTLDSGLNGVTVPVRLYGPFTGVQWELQFKELAKEAAKAKLQPKIDEKKEELKNKAEEKVRDALKGFLK
ncbi:MAG: AsmA family protein [Limnobacter sp.]|jgi:AsmA protein|uniref:AsmA family protein n=1 Tax=Limnobacter sp. TaxID=2003368 RepID=UPI00120D30A4|nr:AsmA family protein [Limnobacter sp.]MDZ4050373.1 AsmA family protein [Limnobacter sp.]RZO92900.1 MAG: AsmA family protein [Limnobacter sp.]